MSGNNSDINQGDKVEFNGEILTVSHIDSWFNIPVFKEKDYPPVEYQKYKRPIKIENE